MNNQRIPKTDSIQELANLWDAHDSTDFEDELEEVQEPVFEREVEISVHLDTRDAQAVRAMAQSLGIQDAELVRGWVLERIHAK